MDRVQGERDSERMNPLVGEVGRRAFEVSKGPAERMSLDHTLEAVRTFWVLFFFCKHSFS